MFVRGTIPALLVWLALLSAGCGSQAASKSSLAALEVIPAARPASAACLGGSSRRLRSSSFAYAAVARGTVRVYRRPGGKVLLGFGRLNVNGVPTVFGILGSLLGADCRPSWYHVQLPLRPNGITGYVRARAVLVGKVRTRIVVDLSARRVTFYRAGRRVLATPAAIGAPATPTPTGRYYVNQRLVPADPTGPFGPGAIGISAFSEVLTGWTQGGPIGIHGTNRPELLGQAVSNGCIRVRNDVLKRLFAATPAGTPVLVRR